MQGRVQRNKYTRTPQVTVVLGNFIFENQVISKSIPGEFGHKPVILVSITAMRTEHYSWIA